MVTRRDAALASAYTILRTEMFLAIRAHPQTETRKLVIPVEAHALPDLWQGIDCPGA